MGAAAGVGGGCRRPLTLPEMNVETRMHVHRGPSDCHVHRTTGVSCRSIGGGWRPTNNLKKEGRPGKDQLAPCIARIAQAAGMPAAPCTRARPMRQRPAKQQRPQRLRAALHLRRLARLLLPPAGRSAGRGLGQTTRPPCHLTLVHAGFMRHSGRCWCRRGPSVDRIRAAGRGGMRPPIWMMREDDDNDDDDA